MNVSIVIVLSTIFNLLSCAKLDRVLSRTENAMPTTSMEFISSPTDLLANYEFEVTRNRRTLDKNIRGELPHFTNPENFNKFLTKPNGSVAKIRCTATGNPTPNITWTKDSQQIIASTDKVQLRKWAIIVEDLKQNDTGIYTCKICNIHGCIDHSTKLDVTERIVRKPIITESPQNVTTAVGTTNTFECKFISDLQLVIQWIYTVCQSCSNATVLQSNVENPEQLTIHNITIDDEGWYTCIASNALGTTASSAYLHVLNDPDENLPTPAKFSHVKSREAQPTATAELSSASTAFQSHPKLAVISKNVQNSNSHEEFESKESNFGLEELHSNNTSTGTTESDMDEFPNENVENEEFLETQEHDDELPFFAQEDQLSKFIPKPSGNMVKIRCVGAGNPMPNITWTKDSNEIARKMGKVQFRKWAIILEDLTPKDTGFYTCKLCNAHGCIDHTTRLEVIDRFPARPYILEGHPTNKTAIVNGSVLFECPIIGDIATHVTWAKYLAVNDTDERPNTIRLETDEDKSEELTLHNITHADEGWYTCIAANSLGTTTASAYLRVVDDLDEKPLTSENKLGSLLGYIIIVSMGALFLVAIFIMLIGFKKLKREKLEKHRAMETVHQWTKKVIIVKPSEDEVDGSDGLQMPIIKIEKHRTTVLQSQYTNDPSSLMNEYEFPLDSNWEFPRNHLKFGPTLGEGAFGRVVMAEAYGLSKPQQNEIVAVKMVKEGHTDADITGLVREMEVMKMIGKHINIINLLGCCSQDGPLYVIVEYAPHGNLKDFLKKNLAMADYNSLNTQHLLTQKELNSFAYQVARGMEYLASRRYIHRDLAARNVLVCDNYIVKIADFGLARDVQESDYYRKCTNGRLPIKWMAPESLRDRFYDSQSDVWSYGILLWEIMTFGDQPYPHILYPSEDLIDYLFEGNRMEKPPRCPVNIYALMRQCWNWKPKCRPTFTEIVFNLENILSSTSNEEYLDLINVPYFDDTNSVPSDGEDQDVVDSFRGPPEFCRPFLR